MKKTKNLLIGAGLLSLVACGDREVFFDDNIGSDRVRIEATKDGTDVHVKVYDWPILNSVFGAERDYYAKFGDNLFEGLYSVVEGDYILESYIEDPGLFSNEKTYSNKNPRDLGVLGVAKWEVRYILNNVFNKIKTDHVDP